MPDAPRRLAADVWADELDHLSWARGAGVIGTEVTVDQPVAAWATELFLDALRTRPVGEALRATRWAMLAAGAT
jgi:hypothetical protein